MDDGGSQIVTGLILFIVFIAVDAILHAFGAAVQGISESDLEQRGGGRDRTEKILKLKEEPGILINTIHVVENLLGVLTGFMIVVRIAGAWSAGLHIAVAVVSVLTAVLLLCVFGIHLPRILGSHFPMGTVFRLVWIVRGVAAVCLPFTVLERGIVHLLARMFGINAGLVQDDVTEEEIISMVNEGHEQGVLEANEAEMINNIFEFGDKEAQDIMTHRKNIVAVNGMLNLQEALQFMLDATNSRFPVYEENIDNITGIIHLKDAMRCHTAKQYDDWLIKDIPELIRPAIFIPETRKINLLFQSMQSKKLQMVMVADEYGQTAGLIALEDILEEIVGNIQDEYDEDENFAEEQPDGSYLIDGMAPLEELEDILGIAFNLEEDIETLNGYLISKLDKIPSEDEHSVIEDLGYRFQIMSVANKTIERVRVEKIPKERIQTEKE
ncbi:MAG: hemolysin family protein [Lachnospiraceae bacterium]|jgi:putative hemolysin|nr:hemolysin family protein [Lachnospiraceae bacterium]